MYLSPYSGVIDGDLREGRVGLLITPQSHRPEQYDVSSFSYWAADNGCYTLGDRFDLDAYLEWLASFDLEARESCLFATAPDVVGDWEATLERSIPVLPKLRAAGFPAALVLQDGATVDSIPWDLVDAVFVGGSTEWKLSEAAGVILEAAAERGLWTHMGRVNSIKRSKLAADLGAYSVDGTLLVFGPDKNAPLIRKAIAQTYEIFGDVLVPAGWNKYARLPIPAYPTDELATVAAYETPGRLARSLETGSVFEHEPHDDECGCLESLRAAGFLPGWTVSETSLEILVAITGAADRRHARDLAVQAVADRDDVDLFSGVRILSRPAGGFEVHFHLLPGGREKHVIHLEGDDPLDNETLRRVCSGCSWVGGRYEDHPPIPLGDFLEVRQPAGKAVRS